MSKLQVSPLRSRCMWCAHLPNFVHFVRRVGTGRTCAGAGICRDVKVLGGDAGELHSSTEDDTMCIQEFQVRY